MGMTLSEQITLKRFELKNKREANKTARKAARMCKGLDRKIERATTHFAKQQIKELAQGDIDQSPIPEEVVEGISKMPLFNRPALTKIAQDSDILVKWTLQYISTYTAETEIPDLTRDQMEFVNAICAKFQANKIFPNEECLDLNLVSVDSGKLVGKPKFLISLDNIVKRRSPEFMVKVLKRKLEANAAAGVKAADPTDPNAPAPIVTPVTDVPNNDTVVVMNATTGEADTQSMNIKNAADLENVQGNLTDEEFVACETVFGQLIQPIGKYRYFKESKEKGNDIITIEVVSNVGRIFKLYVDLGKEVFGFKIVSIRAINPFKNYENFFVPVVAETEQTVKNIIEAEGNYLVTAPEMQLVDSLTNGANFIRNRIDIGSVTCTKDSPSKDQYRILISKLGLIYTTVIEQFKPNFEFYARIERYNNENDFNVVVDNQVKVDENTPLLTGLSATVDNQDIAIVYNGDILKREWGGLPLVNGDGQQTGPTVQ